MDSSSNAAAILAIDFSKAFDLYRSGSTILILHLALVDVALSATTLLATENWVPGGAQCALVGGVTLLLHAVSLWTICGLNYDKFSAICVPLSYSEAVTKWKVSAALAACWALSAGCVLTPLAAGLSYQQRAGLCLPHFRRLPDAAFGIIYICGMLLLPAALIVFFNVRILLVARTQRSRIVSAIVSAVTMNARLAVPQQRLECAQRSRSPLGTTVNVLLPLLLMYVPFASLVTWQSVAGALVDERLALGAHLLLCLSPLNGLIYGCRSKNLRRVFKNFVRKQLYKSEMQLEIQARAPRACLQRPSIATQLTMQLPKHLQRRLSDAFVRTPNQRRRRRRRRRHTRLRRQASELTWAQVSQQLEGRPEPLRAHSTDALPADSDSSAGSPVSQRSPARLAVGAAAIAARAFRFPAAIGGAVQRAPLPIPHDPAAVAAARGQLQPRRHRRACSRSPSPSPPESPWPLGGQPRRSEGSGGSDSSGLWLRPLQHCRPAEQAAPARRSVRLWSHPGASRGERWRAAVPRARSVEPQTV
ncbi:Melatonin-related receptor [Amphibalanus amphitrite]|uniref:Melatonin-related receptor n=1 Tax=Amphibalanus amphitrite TaxID=1232801 RepID=A0A6A4VYW8_AMPAM|nr:Melatonin-related receptor [Amphibalanus amphitrite]